MSIGIVLLAAGNSVRFGGKKLLCEAGGKAMYLRALDTIEKTGLDSVIITQKGTIADEAKSRGMDVIINSAPERGISSSVKLGAKHFFEKDAVMFMVCDQPYLKYDTILRLEQAFRLSEKGIACLCFGKRRGNPVIFSKKYITQLMRLTGDIGGREIIKRYPDDVLYISADETELTDVDRKEDIL